MAELPTGTVTFLFTDMEGSTRLLKELGGRYAEVLAEHRRILRAAFADHGGHEIDTQGYVGLGVHRAARICAAGHGGQVLLSRSTAGVVEEDEIPGVFLRDLGEQRLKDFDRPERIYQLLIEGLPDEFPPLKTLAADVLEREEQLVEVARAADLPGGTITFCFADIHHSTRLLREVGRERFAKVLSEYARLLREAFGIEGGVEVDAVGDSALFAFRTAGQAVRGAAAAQRAVACHEWVDWEGARPCNGRRDRRRSAGS